MKVPVSWLKEYVDFEDTIEGLADKLTFAGLEVEAVPLEAVSRAAGSGVALADRDGVASVGEQGGATEPADARSDDGDIGVGALPSRVAAASHDCLQRAMVARRGLLVPLRGPAWSGAPRPRSGPPTSGPIRDNMPACPRPAPQPPC